MIQFSAYMFFFCGRALSEVRSDCFVASVPNGDEPIFELVKKLDDISRNKAKKALGFMEIEFRKIGLIITAETAKELAEDLDKPSAMRNYQWLINQVESLEKLADKELSGKYFLYIPPEKAKFWPTMKKMDLFGKEVAAKFPSASFDIGNSGVCLATQMGTASVFHLMRVLEIGLTALGNVFGVSMQNTNWAPAIDQIESKIRDMHKDPIWRAKPDCKEQQHFYAQSASHFSILKDAWRNHAMHVRGKYTEDEAERIFETVKAFMRKLAERLKE